MAQLIHYKQATLPFLPEGSTQRPAVLATLDTEQNSLNDPVSPRKDSVSTVSLQPSDHHNATNNLVSTISAQPSVHHKATNNTSATTKLLEATIVGPDEKSTVTAAIPEKHEKKKSFPTSLDWYPFLFSWTTLVIIAYNFAQKLVKKGTLVRDPLLQGPLILNVVPASIHIVAFLSGCVKKRSTRGPRLYGSPLLRMALVGCWIGSIVWLAIQLDTTGEAVSEAQTGVNKLNNIISSRDLTPSSLSQTGIPERPIFPSAGADSTNGGDTGTRAFHGSPRRKGKARHLKLAIPLDTPEEINADAQAIKDEYNNDDLDEEKEKLTDLRDNVLNGISYAKDALWMLIPVVVLDLLNSILILYLTLPYISARRKARKRKEISTSELMRSLVWKS